MGRKDVRVRFYGESLERICFLRADNFESIWGLLGC